MMYKHLKKQLADKKVIEEEIRCNEDRKRLIIQKELGLHATTLSEIKIIMIGETKENRDKFSKTFSKIEVIEKEIDNLKEELGIINESLENIDKIISSMKDREQLVFRSRYIWGLTQKETAERLHFSLDRIKQIDGEIAKKC